MTTPKIEYPRVVTRGEWLEARKRLLVQEKELTQARDRLNADRRRLPMVLMEEPYVFHGPDGERSLLELFEGRLQLIVYHFMWLWADGVPLDRGCANCSGFVDELARGHLQHLHGRSTTLALISRAPIEKIVPFRERMGWSIPWYSSFGSRFNFDLGSATTRACSRSSTTTAARQNTSARARATTLVRSSRSTCTA